MSCVTYYLQVRKLDGRHHHQQQPCQRLSIFPHVNKGENRDSDGDSDGEEHGERDRSRPATVSLPFQVRGSISTPAIYPLPHRVEPGTIDGL